MDVNHNSDSGPTRPFDQKAGVPSIERRPRPLFLVHKRQRFAAASGPFQHVSAAVISVRPKNWKRRFQGVPSRTHRAVVTKPFSNRGADVGREADRDSGYTL